MDHNELNSIIRHSLNVSTFVDKNFHSFGYTCRKLSIYVTYVLLKIGFDPLDILLLDNSVYTDKYISYYDLKMLGYSNNEIQAMFYLVNHKEASSILKDDENSITNNFCECSICLENFCVDAAPVIHLLCGHFYHEKCISEWLKTKFTCPFCRYSLYPSKIKEWLEEDPDSIIYLKIIQQQSKDNVHLIK